MSTAELLGRAIDVLDAHRPVSSGLYALFVNDHQIALEDYHVPWDKGELILVLNSIAVNDGLNSHQWGHLQDRLLILHKQGVL